MEFAGRHHFDRALSLVIKYHPSAFRPSDKELKEMDTSTRRQNTPRTPSGKGKNGGGGGQHNQPAKKRKVDANAPPCHSMAYHGACKKEACKFDHDQARVQGICSRKPCSIPAPQLFCCRFDGH